MPNSISKAVIVDMKRSVGVICSIHATTLPSRFGRRSSETTSVSRRYIRLKFDVPELDLDPLEILSATRDSEQMILEIRRLRPLELAQPFIVRGVHDDDGRLAML